MCKILVLTNTTKVKNQEKLINTVAHYLQDTQKDGFGYAIVGKSGVFGERTIRTDFLSRNGHRDLTVSKDLIQVTYNNFGIPDKGIGAGIFHGRTSTNQKTLNNTHPILKKDWALIHNGVVTDLGPYYKKTTTNDTEDILQHLVTGGIPAIEKYISGYYAVGAIDPEGKLHVIKDSTASLYVAYVKNLECHVFGTTEDLIENVADDLKWTIGPIDVVKDNLYVVFNHQGEIVSQSTFKPLGWGAREKAFAGQSLGRELEGYPDFANVTDVSGKSWDYLDDPYEKNLDSEELYEEEIADMDPSYTVKDAQGRFISIPEFLALDWKSQRSCTVIRPDGTVVCHQDYYRQRLA